MAMGMCPSALAARAADDERLAAALEGADGLALAWWEQLAREACEAGRFSFAGWTREMRRRFGEAGAGGAASQASAPKASRPLSRRAWAAEAPRTRYILPCNGMEKLNPDGSCGCGAYHNEDYWRARDEEWRAESPENAEHPTWDELRNDENADDGGDDDYGDDEETRDDGQP